MARYDGSPDAFPGLRDANPDPNLDRWPDPPAADVEDTDSHDDGDGEESVPRVVDLRPPANPADWSTSYMDDESTSFSLDDSLPSFLADTDEPESDLSHPESDPPHVDALGATPLEPIPTVEPAYEPAYQPSYEPAPEPADYAAYGGHHRLAAEDVPAAAAPAPVVTDDWGIPLAPIGASAAGAESLTAASVLYTPRERPQSGWRKRVYSMSGGKINFGPSRGDRHLAGLIEAARTPITDCHRLAIISLKGGVGKTTTTAALGAMFATLRADRVIAVDANPDRGTLGERLPRESGATVRHLLAARFRLQRYADVRRFTSQSPTRLEVLASDADPSASLAFSEQDYRDTVATLERFYNLILTDCGTGLLHDAMHGVLGLANSLVVVSSASLDGARSASATLDWLEAHGQGALAREAVVVICSVHPGGGMVDVLQLEDHFAARCRAVVTIPYDPHLEAGGVLDLEALDQDTLDAYRELAASVAEGFPAAVR